MHFRQFYLGCLSHASYYIGSRGEAAVIDPQRDVQQYLDEAEANGQAVKYVIETHSHADFVSGHVELAARAGAQIVYGDRANTRFPTLKVRDGDELFVGDVRLRFLETPGHTPEGITVIAEELAEADRSDRGLQSAATGADRNVRGPGDEGVRGPGKMFTGDTLFIGDVGRPDLVGSKGFTAEQMAEMLYDSLHEKILKLPDETEVYPAHGAGSLCGRSLSKETWSTLGQQRRFNYALQPVSKEEFVKLIACDQPEVPPYFPKSAARNLEGSPALADIEKPAELTTEQIDNFDGVVLDVRDAAEYGSGHVPNSVNIGLGGQFASWAGTMIPIGTPIAVVAATRVQVDEAFTRLARVGHDSVKGYLLIGDYSRERRSTEQVPVREAAARIPAGDSVQFVDVRRPAEYGTGHAAGAVNIPLNTLPKEFGRLDAAAPTYVICQGGYRSSLGTSILENAGFGKVFNVTGGTAAWIEAGLETEAESPAAPAGK